MDWASPMDWMCEPFITAKTGLSVETHQKLTVENYCILHERWPELPIIPALQGFALEEYVRCVDFYAEAGVDLAAEPIVGLGSTCRRQHTQEVREIVEELYDAGISLHGYGAKITGFSMYADKLASADSMAWSFVARYQPPLPGHTHKTCANCLEFALMWHEKALAQADQQMISPHTQLSMKGLR